MFPNLKFTIENAENNVKEWQKIQNEKNLLGWAASPPKGWLTKGRCIGKWWKVEG